MECINCGKYTTNPKFCGRSCSCTYNNKTSPKRRPEGPDCSFCGKPITSGHNKYCSKECQILDSDKKVEAGEMLSPVSLRSYLRRHGSESCAICGIFEWNGKELPLILDHIDGDATNNFPSNIRLVCSNCDSQLPTYKGRNKGNGRNSRGIIRK